MLRPLLPLIRTLSRTAPAADAELLDRFARARDEDAFAELVRRHGPAVYHLCRRLVGPDAADDALQATFLVLATRLSAARGAASLGSWLVGTAGRVARQMRRTAARRARHEAAASVAETAIESRVEGPSSTADDLRVLDEELAFLPDRLRAPVVLCFLQGRTQDEAAGVLGQTSRTVRRRLDEAKRRLRMRLERRGVTPAVAVGLVVAAGSAVDGVAAGLIERTTAVVVGFLTGRAAVLSPPVILANGVARTMRMRSLTLFGVVTAVGLAAIGIGLAGGGPPIGAPPPPAPTPPPGVVQEIKPTPPEPSDDERFLREICQKHRGTPPTTAELGYFIGDPDPTKRAKVTRWLSPEHVAKAARPATTAVGGVPEELNKVKARPYVIETPDILSIEVIVAGNLPIPDPVSPGNNLKDPKTREDILAPSSQRLPIQPVSGTYIVRPDGTVGLGFWGSVNVSDLTLEQASAAIHQHILKSPALKETGIDKRPETLRVVLDIHTCNSKYYYVIVADAEGRQSVSKHPFTGNECVLDALGNVKGLAAPEAAKQCIWLSRRSTLPTQPWNVLPVDWVGISQRGQTMTNYQIMAGDRIYVGSQPFGQEQEVLLSLDAPDDIFLLRACMILRGNAPTSIEAGYFLADKAPTKRAKILRWVRADRQDSRQQGQGAAPGETAPPTPFPEIEVTAGDGKVHVRGRFPGNTVKDWDGKVRGGGKKFEVVCKTFQTLADGRLQFTGGDGELARFTSYEPSGAIVSESTARRIIYSPATGSYNVEVNATMKAPEKSEVKTVNSFRSTSTGQ